MEKRNIALNAASAIDDIHVIRRTKENRKVDYQAIYDLVGHLEENHESMTKAHSKQGYYDFVMSPVVRAVLAFNNKSLEEVIKETNNSMHLFEERIIKDLKGILDKFEQLDQLPTTYPLKKIKALGHFALDIDRYKQSCENIIEDPFDYASRLAA